jgi:O-antigen/teichoic acid export membrane protein
MRRFSNYALGIYFTVFIGSAAGIVIKSLVARELGKESLGMYTYFISLNVISGIVFNLGLPSIITKVIAENQPYQRKLSAFSINLMLAIMALGAILSVVLWGRIDPVYSFSLLVLGPSALMPVVTAVFRGELTARDEIIYRLLRRISELLLILVFVIVLQQKTDFSPLIAGAVSWYVATALAVWMIFRRGLVAGFQSFVDILREPWLRTNLILSAALFLGNALTIIGGEVDKLIVGNFLGFADLGEYGAAILFFGLLGQVLEVVSGLYITIFPRDDNKTLPKYNKYTWVNLLCLPLIGLSTLLAIPFLSPILLGDGFVLVVPIFTLVSFSFVFKGIEMSNQALAIAIDKPYLTMQSTIWGIMIYVPLLYILVSNLGVYGAAIGQSFFWALYSIFQMYLLRKDAPEHMRSCASMLLRTLLVYCIALGVYFMVGETVWRYILPIVVYIVLGHVMNIWDGYFLVDLARMFISQARTLMARRVT